MDELLQRDRRALPDLVVKIIDEHLEALQC